MILVKNIYINKGNKAFVKNASFEIVPGRISVILGKNGAGKSTLLEGLTGQNSIRSGTVLWDRQELSQISTRKLAIRRAVLSQKTNIPFSIQVKQLVEMGTYVSDEPLSNIKTDNLVTNALTEVNMLPFIHRDFMSLSGGEQKRVMFAKCIVQLNCCHWSNIHKYLFLDEPTASLDIEQQYNFIDLVKRFVKRRNIGVLAIVHDINLAAQFADEIILLRDGMIVEKGHPEFVLTPEKIKRVFDVHSMVQKHPFYGCPLVTTIPVTTFSSIDDSLNSKNIQYANL